MRRVVLLPDRQPQRAVAGGRPEGTRFRELLDIRESTLLGSCDSEVAFLDCVGDFFGKSAVLDISELPDSPDADDWAFVFSGRNTISDLRSPQGAPWRVADVAKEWSLDLGAAMPLGFWQGRAAWTFSVPEARLDPIQHVTGNLYSLLGRVDDNLFHAHGRAYQLLHWADTHRHCGRCGASTTFVESGRAVLCETCSLRVYPRVSPCVIVLVSKGNQMLLAAAAGFQKRFYSTLAGFMEPGETCEQAVIREVREEVGIEVGNVRYFASQPWPFPSQVMLGFFAEWQTGEIELDPNEIEDADWFDMRAMPPTPPMASISGQLISHFMENLPS